MILRSRIVLPVAQPPIENGAVVVIGNRIAAVGSWPQLASTAREEVVDLGETILLPGLVNAHCHLDYTDMAGQIAPAKSFTDWIKALVAFKATWSYTDFAQSWLHGARMLLRTGTTTVADIEAVPELLPEVWEATPLRVISFLELLHVKSQFTPKQLVEAAVARLSPLPISLKRVGLSPHAPYSTSAGLLQQAVHAAARRNWRLSTHVAESEEEFEMFMYRHGPLYDWLKPQRDMSDCGHGSPLKHLAELGYLCPNLLAVHVNYLWRHDAALLGKARAPVVHCPRSHAYFRHLVFPREELAAAGVNICLGTDSLASTRKPRRLPLELNMFAEMQSLAGAAPELAPFQVVQMATVNGARALGLHQLVGELTRNAWADLIAIPFAGNVAHVYDDAVHHQGDVIASMIDGQWAIAPGSK
ncbi:MAG TPA: amidohydrolase family protein [Verrucomicrobiae bacterium]|jgi:cytosine/adenosine deaminase-related metal-dependent hydrolase